MRRVLFVIRGKLGDSLLAFATVQAWRAAHPADEIHVIASKAYARLFSDDALRLRIFTFNNRAHLMLLSMYMRFQPRYDALFVLWGFGRPIARLGRWVRAQKKYYLDDRFSGIFDESPPPTSLGPRIEPAWRVARLFDPTLAKPEKLYLPELAAKRPPLLTAEAPVGLVPLANEMRRSLSADLVRIWLRAIMRMHPGRRIQLLLNPADLGAQRLIAEPWPPEVETVCFANIDQLIGCLSGLQSLVTTDTGLYHLAAAMGVPTTVYFGPTEPPCIILPQQTGCDGIRLKVLGRIHCEVKDCWRPYCLDRAISNQAGELCPTSPMVLPQDCPLRAFPEAEFAENRHWLPGDSQVSESS